MENISLSHIGGELVLIGGIAFYFHRKTNNLQEQITALTEENKELCETIEELKNGLQQLATMIMQNTQQTFSQPVSRSVPQMRHVSQPSAQRQQKSIPLRRQVSSQQPVPQPVSQPIHQQLTHQKQRETFTKTSGGDSDDSGDDTYENDYLDAEIGDELAKLSKETNCDDDQCKLVD